MTTTTTTTITAELAASIRQYPLAVGTEVTFLPTRADYDGRDAATGVVTERVTERDETTTELGLYRYVITCPGGATAVRDGYMFSTPDNRLVAAVVPTALLQGTPEVAPAPAPAILPRRSEDAARVAAFLPADDDIADALATLVKFLPGGEVEAMGRKLSDDRTLCAVYDRTVVPAMGYDARPHCVSEVPDHLASQFAATVDALEAAHADDPRAGVRAMAARYTRGGVVNQAILDAISDHLEAHKVPAANALLEALGMDTAPTSSEYSVLVTVSRTITVTQQVELFITADDEDSVHDEVSMSALADASGDYWEAEDGTSICLGSAGRYDIDDYDVDEVNAI